MRRLSNIEAARTHLKLDSDAIREFCRRWQITELALFGSVVRDDFGPASDVDVMVHFSSKAEHSLWDFVEMQLELESLFGRPVDLIEQGTIRSPFRRRGIERDLTVIYAS